MSRDELSGFDELSEMLKEFAKTATEENIIEILQDGAEEVTKDLLKLPKPKSNVSKSGYTHLVDTFAYKRNGNEVEVGWGKYYGPMVERGTKRMKATAHVSPLWESNKEKYYKKMTKGLFD